MIRNKFTILLMCIICLATITMSGFTFSNADSAEIEDAFPLYLNGIKITDGYKIGEATYTSVRDFSEALCDNLTIKWDSEANSVLITADELSLSSTTGDRYICVNDRYLLVEGGIRLHKGSMIAPLDILSEAFGVQSEWDEETASITINAEKFQVIEPAESFYNDNDLYWLSRLINSEAGNQPLEGKIAVGNVVMNRVEDKTCPDTIYNVIFDVKYGVQFSVVSTGGIYLEPTEESIIAAKICLDGGSLTQDAIYFVNPTIGSTAWFRNTRTYVGTYGDHDFYA